jgi:hypothetical protein
LQSEGLSAEKEALKTISREAAGSVRDALSILDQAIIYSDGKLESELQGNTWTFLFYFGCCLGLPLGFLGIILLIFGRNKKGEASDQYIVIQDGNVMVTNQENYNSIINQSEHAPEEVVPSPFVKEVEEVPISKSDQPSEQEFDEWKSWDDG